MRTTFFILLLSSILSAQNDEAFVDALVAQKMAELELQQNNEYFSRKNYCLGNIQMFTLPNGERCISKSTYYSVYVFWKIDEDKMSLQKFDNCGSFKPFTIEIDKPIKKALKDKQALVTEQVEPYKGEEVEANPYGNMNVQSCHKHYKFVFDGMPSEKNFSEYDLSNDSKFNNVNAGHNNALQLIKLDNALSALIQNYEQKGKFFRENQ